jgi:hypothetical protein
MKNVPTLHIPITKDFISKALNNNEFMLNTKIEPDVYIYKN